MQDWPDHLPLPPFVVVDYDTEGAANDEIGHFDIGNTEAEALCRSDTPTVFESLPDALSPRAVLAALDEPVQDDMPAPLAIARRLRQAILDLDADINAAERSPTGDDYNDIYLQANCGLIELLKPLGDPSTSANSAFSTIVRGHGFGSSSRMPRPQGLAPHQQPGAFPWRTTTTKPLAFSCLIKSLQSSPRCSAG
ncbi:MULTISPECIES: hypothetical protein [unclassified Brenneria]|uniref:hypothetical protein n=1 Tax=unclassified Brenneria TaxID=2634434 RepID=UPI0018F10565|nr:hypothetical protein [Brenneria sp. L3-3C-1]MBJ7223598.1 hypothetical protein [Brenneria sp. L3-3C-1]MEE3644840.1 hypothetical protein [Brenneria sp. L3_3C_1]